MEEPQSAPPDKKTLRNGKIFDDQAKWNIRTKH